MTLADRYTFGDREHTALRMVPCQQLHDVEEMLDDAPDMLAIARDLVKRGFSVIPLDHPDNTWVTNPDDIGKTPAIKWKRLQDALATDADLVDWFSNGKRNAAILTGATSNLIMVDGDSAEGLAWMRAHLPLTPLRTRTKKGEHWGFRHPGVPIKNKVRIRTGNPAIKVDVRGDGGYVVAPGSLHVTRITYERLGDWPPVSELPVFDPAWLEPDDAPALVTTPKVLPTSIPHGQRHDTLFREGCRLRYRGYAEAEIADALWSLHAHRSEGPAVPRENIDKIAASICQQYEPGQTAFVEYTKPASKKGQIVADHQGNVRFALAQLGLELSYNAFAAKDLATYQGSTQLLDDVVVQRAWLQVDELFHFRPSLRFFEIVVKDLARRRSVHPVRDYLDSLKWDGESRINTWLHMYGGAKDVTASEADDSLSYLEAVSSIFLIAAIRRVRQPGCKFDELLVLEAPQGTLKSSALRVLCPDDNWFSDDLPLGVSAKEIIERTAGKWIIEASELQGYTNAQVDHLKGMLARQVDGPVRLAYGHFSVEVPRQFLMVGTTNKLTEYLRDSTGNRRFWPVRVTRFDVAALARDRDQLPERAHGKYLLSGGMLVCPQCGGHFEARIAPWKGQANVYICGTRRRKPGVCTNTLALPIAETDDDVLGIVEGEVLGTRFIEELLALVDTTPDPTAQLAAERQRLAGEIDNLVKSVAKGMPAEVIAPAVKAHQAEVARLDVALRAPRAERPNIDRLRDALMQRAARWKADLRAEPKVARLLLRRLVGPLTLWEEPESGARWDAPIQADSLLDGIVQLGASLMPASWNQIAAWLDQIDRLRRAA